MDVVKPVSVADASSEAAMVASRLWGRSLPGLDDSKLLQQMAETQRNAWNSPTRGSLDLTSVSYPTHLCWARGNLAGSPTTEDVPNRRRDKLDDVHPLREPSHVKSDSCNNPRHVDKATLLSHHLERATNSRRRAPLDGPTPSVERGPREYVNESRHRCLSGDVFGVPRPAASPVKPVIETELCSVIPPQSFISQLTAALFVNLLGAYIIHWYFHLVLLGKQAVRKLPHFRPCQDGGDLQTVHFLETCAHCRHLRQRACRMVAPPHDDDARSSGLFPTTRARACGMVAPPHDDDARSSGLFPTTRAAGAESHGVPQRAATNRAPSDAPTNPETCGANESALAASVLVQKARAMSLGTFERSRAQFTQWERFPLVPEDPSEWQAQVMAETQRQVWNQRAGQRRSVYLRMMAESSHNSWASRLTHLSHKAELLHTQSPPRANDALPADRRSRTMSEF